MIASIIAIVIFLGTIYLIFSEKLNRVIAAVSGASLMVIAGIALGFYSEKQAAAALDLRTIGLLFGMMTLVALLEPTGFFQYLAVLAAGVSKGRPVRLLVLLGSVTTLISMFLDNVTTVVLIAPVTILISEILGMNPTPFLMSEALLSNTGGIATLVGDPPNVMIASASGLTFGDFLTYSLPIIAVAWFVALILLRYLFRKELSETPSNVQAVLSLDPVAALNAPKIAVKVLIVLGTAILLFFFEEPLGLSSAAIALSSSAAAMLWVRPDMHKTLNQIEWGVLVFFAALFVMVGGLEAAGVLTIVAQWVAGLGHSNQLLFGISLLWLVAGLSAVIDNIPVTIALIPVIQGLGQAGMNMTPLWWALAFGAGLGGNGTIIGSTANVVVATLSERTRTPLTSQLWNKRGLPIMLATLGVTSILYVLAYPLFLP